MEVEQALWEELTYVQKDYHDFNLEGMVSFRRGVMSQVELA